MKKLLSITLVIALSTGMCNIAWAEEPTQQNLEKEEYVVVYAREEMEGDTPFNVGELQEIAEPTLVFQGNNENEDLILVRYKAEPILEKTVAGRSGVEIDNYSLTYYDVIMPRASYSSTAEDEDASYSARFTVTVKYSMTKYPDDGALDYVTCTNVSGTCTILAIEEGVTLGTQSVEVGQQGSPHGGGSGNRTETFTLPTGAYSWTKSVSFPEIAKGEGSLFSMGATYYYQLKRGTGSWQGSITVSV